MRRLDDPFPDPPHLVVPDSIPTKPPDNSTRIAEDEDPLATLPEEEAESERRKQAARAAALTLEMVGDLPFANVRPPENVLFVCKLNPVTRDEDLELIFSRFGSIMSCQVIRDKRTGDSLQYAFIEFDKREDAEQVCSFLCLCSCSFQCCLVFMCVHSCSLGLRRRCDEEGPVVSVCICAVNKKLIKFFCVCYCDSVQAYFKMQNVLVDDRRIWVDLCVVPCPLFLTES